MPGKAKPVNNVPRKVNRRRKRKAQQRATGDRVYLTTKARNEVTTSAKTMGGGQLSKAITLPGETRAIRWNTSITQGSIPSAVSKLSSYKNLSYTSGLPTFMLTHSPVNPVWGIGTFLARKATWTTQVDTSVTAQYAYSAIPFPTLVDPNPAVCYPMAFTSSDNTNNNGPMGYFIPQGSTASFDVIGTWTGTGSATLHYVSTVQSSMSTAKTAVITTAAPGPATQLIDTSTESVWIYPTKVVLTGVVPSTTVQIAIRVAAGTFFGPILPMPSIDAIAPVAEELRVNAASLLITNTTAKLYANGAVTAARLDWRTTPIFTQSAAVEAVADTAIQLRYSGPATKGVYTYMLPTSTSLAYTDYTDASTIGVNQIGDFQNVNYIVFDVAMDVGSKMSLLMRYDAHIEYRTTLQMYPLALPTMTLDEMNALLTVCGGVTPFSENFTHLAMFMQLAKRLAQMAAPYMAPYARKAIKYAADKADNYLAQF